MKVAKYSQDNTNFITSSPAPAKVMWEEGTWTQPTLTENGTLGKQYFAVAANAHYQSEDAYMAFDGKETTQFTTSGNTGTLTFYFPRPMKVTNLNIMNGYNSSYVRPISQVVVSGSDNNSSWTQLATHSNTNKTAKATWNVSLSSNTTFYKYYKLNITGDGSNGRITKLAITATAQNKLTLKSGSKVYIPNGFNGTTPVFEELTTTANKSATLNDKTQRPFYYMSDTNTIGAYANHSSGTGPTLSSGNEVVYRTDTNRVELYVDGTLSRTGLSLPFLTCIGTQYIVTTFNSVGFIGNYFYAFPHVKGNIPNGFYSNGTNQVIKFEYDTVKLRPTTSDWYGLSRSIRFFANEIQFGNLYLDTTTNYNRTSLPSGDIRYAVYGGSCTINDTGKVTAISNPTVKSATIDSYQVHKNGSTYKGFNL